MCVVMVFDRSVSLGSLASRYLITHVSGVSLDETVTYSCLGKMKTDTNADVHISM